MKIFQTVQKNLAALGLAPNRQQNNNWHLTAGQIGSVVICSVDVIKLGVYIFCEASSIEEYMDLIFSLTFVAGVTLTYTSMIFKNDKVFITIELCAKELNDSELMSAIRSILEVKYENKSFSSGSTRNPAALAMHEKTVRLVEKLTEIIYFAAMKFFLPAAILPKVIISYFNYYAMNSGDIAFQLPYPAWYVLMLSHFFNLYVSRIQNSC